MANVPVNMGSPTKTDPNLPAATTTNSQTMFTSGASMTAQTNGEPTSKGAEIATGPKPQISGSSGPQALSITTTSLLTTSTDGHLTTVPVTTTIPNPSLTDMAHTTWTSVPSNPDKSPAIIGGVIGAVFIGGWIIVFFLFIKPCLRRRRQSREKVESGADHHGEIPDMSDDTTAVTPFLVSATRVASQQIHNYEKQGPEPRLLPHPQSPSPESHTPRQSMTDSEEIRNQVMEISRQFDLNPPSTARSATPNPFADSTVASESRATPQVGSDGPSPQLIDLIAERVVEMLRVRDPGIGEARANMPPGNGRLAQVQRVSQLSQSDRSSRTAPPTYATDEE